jgi:hypothetical protein
MQAPDNKSNYVLTYLFFTTFVLIATMLMLNLFIAVLLESFERKVSPSEPSNSCLWRF